MRNFALTLAVVGLYDFSCPAFVSAAGPNHIPGDFEFLDEQGKLLHSVTKNAPE